MSSLSRSGLVIFKISNRLFQTLFKGNTRAPSVQSATSQRNVRFAAMRIIYRHQHRYCRYTNHVIHSIRFKINFSLILRIYTFSLTKARENAFLTQQISFSSKIDNKFWVSGFQNMKLNTLKNKKAIVLFSNHRSLLKEPPLIGFLHLIFIYFCYPSFFFTSKQSLIPIKHLIPENSSFYLLIPKNKNIF